MIRECHSAMPLDTMYDSGMLLDTVYTSGTGHSTQCIFQELARMDKEI